MNEFYQVCLAQQYIAEGGISYAKELLEKALGEEKAQDVITKLTASLTGSSVRIYPKDRSESGAELYPGRASTDNCDDTCLICRRHRLQ